MLEHHYESRDVVAAAPPALFAHLDQHDRFSGHMSESSWMMAGGRMQIETDELAGRAVGSKIRLSGRVLGLRLFVEEAVTEYELPYRKAWETVGDVRLLVIGPYRMGFEITPDAARSRLRVFIDYALPSRGLSRWLRRGLGSWYARWCTSRMVMDGVRAFQSGGDAARLPMASTLRSRRR